jgi:hypothetical protein
MISALMSGCGRSEDADSLMAALVNERDQLQADLDEIERQQEVLLAENRWLTDRHLELTAWATKTALRFGPGIWYVHDQVYPFFVKPMTSGGVPEIIEELNHRFAKSHLPEVIFLGQEQGTVLVGVSDDDLLTRRLGSFGAASYMNAVLFSLLSVEDVTCVTFKFEEGDHAVPGTRCDLFPIK